MAFLAIKARALVRQVAYAAADILPMKSLLCRWGAVAPPCVRTGYTMSFFSRLASHLVANQKHLTNMGIHPYLRCELPLHNGLLQFGSPKLYAGEQSSLELIGILARDSKAFIDVGAHLGYYTFYVATRAQRPPVIHFFEPEPALFATTERNVVANELTGVFGHCVALDAVTGQSKFISDADNPLVGRLAPLMAGNSTEHRDHPSNANVVKTKTFAAFLGEHAINSTCVKVDVEGAEFRFLDGIGDAGNKIDTLVVEVLGRALSDGFVKKASSVLGMHAYYIGHRTLQHSPDGKFDYVPSEYNWLFCRASPEALRRRLAGTPFSVT